MSTLRQCTNASKNTRKGHSLVVYEAIESAKRYTLSNRFEYFLPAGFNVALTANYAHEESNFPSSFSYVYNPRPPGFGWDTTFNLDAHGSSNYMWIATTGVYFEP